jgi:hypothetical protein
METGVGYMTSSTRNKEKPAAENSGMPRELAEAIAAAETVLAHAEHFGRALTETGKSLPACLAQQRELNAELRRVELAGGDDSQVRGQLDQLAGKAAFERRRRTAASEALMRQEGELIAVRNKVDEARKLFAAAVAAEFVERWNATLRAQEAMRAEAAEYSKAFGTTFSCPLPYEARTNQITGKPELHLVDQPSGPAVALPPPVAAIIRILDRLDSASALSQGIRAGFGWTKNYFELARERGFRTEMSGLFEVAKPFDSLGTHFERGMLIDRGVLGEGLTERFWRGRELQPVVGDAGIAASYSTHTAA